MGAYRTSYPCRDCKHDKGKCIGHARTGPHKNCFEQKISSNADRIRGMSDEELAAWICLPDCDAERYETCITITTEKTFDVPYDRQTDPLHDVLDWLRQPAETEGTE